MISYAKCMCVVSKTSTANLPAIQFFSISFWLHYVWRELFLLFRINFSEFLFFKLFLIKYCNKLAMDRLDLPLPY